MRSTDSGKFMKNVLIGAFFPTPVSKDTVERSHNSAVKTHNEAVKLHDEATTRIMQTAALLAK